MAEYLIIKREECAKCDGRGWIEVHGHTISDEPLGTPCNCSAGYIETQVPLLDVLKAIQIPRSSLDFTNLTDTPFPEGTIIAK